MISTSLWLLDHKQQKSPKLFNLSRNVFEIYHRTGVIAGKIWKPGLGGDEPQGDSCVSLLEKSSQGPFVDIPVLTSFTTHPGSIFSCTIMILFSFSPQLYVSGAPELEPKAKIMCTSCPNC